MQCSTIILVLVVGLASWPPPHVANECDPHRCLVYNEASLMVASVGASTETALLTFGKHTYTIIQQVTERLGDIIGIASAVGEHLCSEVWRLAAGNSWFSTFVLYPSISMLASQANQTLQSTGSSFSSLGATVQSEMYAHTERVCQRLLAVVSAFMREANDGLRNVTDATPQPGACNYEYERACSLALMREMQMCVVQCMTRYGSDVLDRLGAFEEVVLELQSTVSRLLDGVGKVDQESASEVSGAFRCKSNCVIEAIPTMAINI